MTWAWWRRSPRTSWSVSYTHLDVYKRQSLYCYWLVHGEPEKAKDAIRELLKVAYPGAFAHTKAIPIAKRLGLLE